MNQLLKTQSGWAWLAVSVLQALAALILWVALEIRADVIELKLSNQATQLRLKSDHHRLDTLETRILDHEARLRVLEQSR